MDVPLRKLSGTFHGTTGSIRRKHRFVIAIHSTRKKKGPRMLYTIAVVLVILWLLGLVTSYTMGGLVHVLLVIAIVVVLLKVIRGQKVL